MTRGCGSHTVHQLLATMMISLIPLAVAIHSVESGSFTTDQQGHNKTELKAFLPSHWNSDLPDVIDDVFDDGDQGRGEGNCSVR